MNVVSYIRVSGRGQLAGDGPERQRDSVIAFARGNGLLHTGEFFEQGVSGTVEGIDRPAFGEMLDAIMGSLVMDAAKIEGIVVERMDRLARDLMVQEFLLKECRDRGIQVFAADVGLIDQATNDGDPTRKLIRQVLGAVAEFAKSELVLKLAKARKRKREATGKCEGQKAYGQSQRFPTEKPVLQFVQGLAASGEPMTGREVASLLNQAGFLTRWGRPYTRQIAEHLIKRVKGK